MQVALQHLAAKVREWSSPHRSGLAKGITPLGCENVHMASHIKLPVFSVLFITVPKLDLQLQYQSWRGEEALPVMDEPQRTKHRCALCFDYSEKGPRQVHGLAPH